MRPEFSRIADDYQRYRPAYAPRLFERLRGFEIGLPGRLHLDIGAGTGRFGRELVARGAPVISLDLRPELLATAPGAQVTAKAESLPFAHEQFDVVCCADCWHWLDRGIAPRQVLRVLRPQGKIAVTYQMHVPMPASVTYVTEQLILRHQPNWAHANSAGINGQVLRDLQCCGFVGIESFTFDCEIEFSQEQWRGYVRTLSSVGASMSPQALEQFDREHQQLLESFPTILCVPHRVFAVVANKPADPIIAA